LTLTRPHPDNTGMDEKPVKRAAGGAAAVAVIVVVFLILPMIYLLALGPIAWLHSRGHLEVGPNSLIARAYAPLEWTAQACPPFERAMGWYLSLWDPPIPPTQFVPAPVPVPAPPSAASAVPAPTLAAPASTPIEP
jgi:hypothetical protein